MWDGSNDRLRCPHPNCVSPNRLSVKGSALMPPQVMQPETQNPRQEIETKRSAVTKNPPVHLLGSPISHSHPTIGVSQRPRTTKSKGFEKE
jgi:hypothetical protein